MLKAFLAYRKANRSIVQGIVAAIDAYPNSAARSAGLASQDHVSLFCDLHRPAKATYRITARGREALVENPARIDLAFLKRYPELAQFRGRGEGGRMRRRPSMRAPGALLRSITDTKIKRSGGQMTTAPLSIGSLAPKSASSRSLSATASARIRRYSTKSFARSKAMASRCKTCRCLRPRQWRAPVVVAAYVLMTDAFKNGSLPTKIGALSNSEMRHSRSLPRRHSMRLSAMIVGPIKFSAGALPSAE